VTLALVHGKNKKVRCGQDWNWQGCMYDWREKQTNKINVRHILFIFFAMQDLREGSVPLQTLRLLIVGFGGVGKSTLMRALCASDEEMAVFHHTVGKGRYREQRRVYTHTRKRKDPKQPAKQV
jgi:hypothetical protein